MSNSIIDDAREALAANRIYSPGEWKRLVAGLLDQWQDIETAPKDGRSILLLSVAYDDEIQGNVIHHPAKCAIGRWDPEGTSWVDEYGELTGDCHHLEETGLWYSGFGWFQPNEVSHWQPIPSPPAAPEKEAK